MIIHDFREDRDLLIGKMHSTLFRHEIDVILYGQEESLRQYAEQCAAFFNFLPPVLLYELKEASIRYCEDIQKYTPSDNCLVPSDVSHKTILRYVRPNSMIVERPKDSEKLAFQVEFSCDWEPEHGMEWTINDGQALYVGDFMGISPWYAPRVYQTECRSYIYDNFSLYD